MLRILAIAAALLCFASPAQAHLVDIRFGDFYGGALHLLTGLQYALLLGALCLFAALQPPQTGRWMLLAAPLGMAVGALASLLLPGPQITVWLTGALAVFGIATALHLRARAALLFVGGAVAAALLGYENGLAMASGATDTWLFISGLIAASILVVWLLTAALTRLAEDRAWAQIALRTLGSWMAAVAVILLALSVSGGAGLA